MLKKKKGSNIGSCPQVPLRCTGSNSSFFARESLVMGRETRMLVFKKKYIISALITFGTIGYNACSWVLKNILYIPSASNPNNPVVI